MELNLINKGENRHLIGVMYPIWSLIFSTKLIMFKQNQINENLDIDDELCVQILTFKIVKGHQKRSIEKHFIQLQIFLVSIVFSTTIGIDEYQFKTQ